jgi:hypothetical protein
MGRAIQKLFCIIESGALKDPGTDRQEIFSQRLRSVKSVKRVFTPRSSELLE